MATSRRSWAAIGDWSGAVHVIDLDAWMARSEKVLTGTIEAIAFSPDGDSVAVGDMSYFDEHILVVCQESSLTVARRVSSEDSVTALTFTADGAAVLWGDYGGRLSSSTSPRGRRRR